MRGGGAPYILLAAAFGLAACSSLDSTRAKSTRIGQPPPKRQPQISPLKRKVLSLLEKKQYRQAIESMNGRYHEGLEKEFVLSINRQLEIGDNAYSAGDYSMAAHSYKCVLNAYPAEPALRKQIKHEPKKIRSNMEFCTSRMMEQGLSEYRCGRLESAIGKWKDLLTISPGNNEARKALDTATIQLQSLQNLKDK